MNEFIFILYCVSIFYLSKAFWMFILKRDVSFFRNYITMFLIAVFYFKIEVIREFNPMLVLGFYASPIIAFYYSFANSVATVIKNKL